MEADFHHRTEEELEKVPHVERLQRDLACKGSIIDLYRDRMRLPDGREEDWDLVAHRRGAAAVVSVLPDGNLLMVRQYRPALDRWTLEIPAGARDSTSEDTLVTAKRELREETGYHSSDWSLLLRLKTTVAFCNEFVDVYLAEDLKDREDQKLDEAEVILLEEWSLPDLLGEIRAGRLQDSKTVSGVLAYESLLRERERGK